MEFPILQCSGYDDVRKIKSFVIISIMLNTLKQDLLA